MLIGTAAIIMAAVQLPLSVTLPMVMPKDSGLSARMASGTVWSGMLHDAQLGGLPLGDTRIALLPLPLLTGQARLRFAGSKLSGTLVAAPGGFGIAHATGPIDAAVRLKMLPVTQLVLDNATVQFSGNRCAQAAGTVRAMVGGDVGGIALPGGMTGLLRCDGRALLIPLAGQSGMERLTLHIEGDGKWRAEFSVRAADQATIAKLANAGFVQGASGYVIRMTGTL